MQLNGPPNVLQSSISFMTFVTVPTEQNPTAMIIIRICNIHSGIEIFLPAFVAAIV